MLNEDLKNKISPDVEELFFADESINEKAAKIAELLERKAS